MECGRISKIPQVSAVSSAGISELHGNVVFFWFCRVPCDIGRPQSDYELTL